METAPAPAPEPTKTTQGRPRSSSVMESTFRGGCGLARGGGGGIQKEELRKRLAMPKYLRLAIRNSIRFKDPNYTTTATAAIVDDPAAAELLPAPPEAEAEAAVPMVVFINPRSGGRHGPQLKLWLQLLIAEEQVFDLQDVKPHEFVQYGLGCLEKLASLGDTCADQTRKKLRVMVAGGDGTVGWVLGCLGDLYRQGREPMPPVGVIPLGTGNDLSRSFGWGGSFPFAWKSAIKRTLDRASKGEVALLDSWDLSLSMPSGEDIVLPHSLKPKRGVALDEGLKVEGQLPETASSFEGVFYNYFSIGMDAQVAYGFHNLRNDKPYLAHGPIVNKMIYSGYSCSQGWFFTPCTSDPSLRGLNNILQMQVKRLNSTEWERIQVPSSVRAIVALNLQNYASGRNPWGKLKREYLDKRGFVEARPNDGVLEIFGLKQAWHASFVMVELISAKHIAQVAAVRLELKGGERWRDAAAYMQMDGEPWRQPLSKGDSSTSTVVEINRVPFHSLMIQAGLTKA